MKDKTYQAIASKLISMENCRKSSNDVWLDKHADALDAIMDNAPSGSGIDNGVKLLLEDCGRDKLVFQCDFHHMDEHGYYDGWSHHKVTVKPSLFHGITVSISGRNRNDIKEYLGEVLHTWLTEEVH
jgi:hypothetical protein